jgi:hypothetical protein
MIRMKRLLIICLGLAPSFIGFSQSCLPEGITFTNQEQIDNFQINYPNCTQIEGDLIVGDFGTNITNLDGLNVLTSIGGDLYITQSIYLNNLMGLINVTFIGQTLGINNTDVLTSLVGLNNLAFIGNNLAINNNSALTSLTDLNNLTFVGGSLEICWNYSLTNMIGLENITSIGGNISIHSNSILSTCDLPWLCEYLSNPVGIVDIYGNAAGCNDPPEIASVCGIVLTCLPSGNYYFFEQSEIDNFKGNYSNCAILEGNVLVEGISNINNLNGLNEVTYIGGNLDISYNYSLTSLTGLNNLGTIGGRLKIERNDDLTSLAGLEGLTSIGGDLRIKYNHFLTSLTELEGMNSIGGDLYIGGNVSLTSLTGLDNIAANTISNLSIFINSSLSTCDIQSICDYLAAPNGLIYIEQNATGCNSQEEVQTACTVRIEENNISDYYLNIYPNPTFSKITIETSVVPNSSELTICNLSGQKIIILKIKDIKTEIDISDLPKGIYYVKVTNHNAAKVCKIVKN